MRKHLPSFKQHIERYAYAAPFCYKRKVLDIGSNIGFGAHLLSYGANTITQSDVSEHNLAFAQKNFKYFCPQEYVQCDLGNDFPAGIFDTIVAFEVIEHIENTDVVLRNVADHLNNDGYFIFSVPHMIANREHKVLFDEEKIRTAVEKYFNIKEFHIQTSAVDGSPLYKGLKVYVGVAQPKT
jgi:2-polyprenyl-3-methyl-5-hydroxy-6-metoxy-1,4-benzoquinol methylase